jgi:hypothetical protein
MTKERCSVGGHFRHFGFVIHSSFVIRHSSFSCDELAIALADSGRPAAQRGCHHALHAPMEIIEQRDFYHRGTHKFLLQLLDLRSISHGRT